jgi:hypothetical protein
MNLKLFIGIALFVFGLAMAVVGITRVGDTDTAPAPAVVAENNRSEALLDGAESIAIPLAAALSLAVGGLLIGISVGNWKHPRTHLKPGDEVVNPEGYHKMKHV